MNYSAIIRDHLEKNNIPFDRAADGFVIRGGYGTDTDMRLSCDGSGTLWLTARLPCEARPGDTEEVITAVNSANAFANFGGFALSPADQTVRYRGYVRLRGDVEGELDYLFERAKKTLGRFAPHLCAVCERKLTAGEFAESLNRAYRAGK